MDKAWKNAPVNHDFYRDQTTWLQIAPKISPKKYHEQGGPLPVIGWNNSTYKGV